MAKMSLGMKSKIFTTRGEQLVKEVWVKSATNYERWIPKEREEFAYEEEVCCPTNEREVRKVIRSLKLNRAAGVDNVSSAMLKGASPTMITLITGIINESLMEENMPSSLQIGKMTLIDCVLMILTKSGQEEETMYLAGFYSILQRPMTLCAGKCYTLNYAT